MTTLQRSALLLLLLLSGCRTEIQHGLDERAANEIVSALVSRGLDARKVAEKGKKPTWAIELDEPHATEATRVLIELKLPRPARTTTREVTEQTSLIETPGAERLRQLEAQEGDLEQALESMDGVTSAAVELVVPPPPRPGAAAGLSKASVLLRVAADASERMQRQRPEVRALVAAAVDGLNPDDVVLVIDVVVMPEPTELPEPASNGWLLVALAVSLSVVSLGALLLALKLRQKPLLSVPVAPSAEPSATTRTAPTPRPVISPALQRKAQTS